jgi:hypothetical protein
MQTADTKEEEIYELAATLLSQGKTEAEVRSSLEELGLDGEYISTVLANITKYHKEEKSKAANSNMLIGGLVCAGGIIATMMSEGQVLFYGAILFGGLQFLIGLIKSSSE